MTFGTNCLCDGRDDVECTKSACSIAGPGAPGDANSCRPCWIRLQRRSSITNRFAMVPCTHLGEVIGEGEATCLGCGMQGKNSDVYSCSKYEMCTVEYSAELNGRRIKCCRQCPDYSPKPVIQVKSHSAGIGDNLMVLPVAEGLKRQHPESEIFVVAPLFSHQWLSLFSGFRILESEIQAPLCFCDNSGDYDAFTSAGLPRWQFWAEKFGTRAALPEPRPIPQAALDWAVEYAGCIMLSPYAAYPERTWSVHNWLEVEERLRALGFKVAVMDDRHGRCDRFQCGGKLINQSATRVAAVLSRALCFAGNDSGMAHVAGFLGTPSVVVEGHSDANIMGLYPATTALGASLARTRPADVVRAILQRIDDTVRATGFPVDDFLSALPERDLYREPTWPPIYAALWRTVHELSPKVVVEIGGRAGAGAWVMFNAVPDARIISYDIDEWDPDRICDGGFVGSAAHARKILAGSDYSRMAADSHQLDRIPPCDLCYVDGDHSQEGCLSDLMLAERSGAGAILCDDYCLGSVQSAVALFLKGAPHRRGRFIPSQTGLFLITGGP